MEKISHFKNFLLTENKNLMLLVLLIFFIASCKKDAIENTNQVNAGTNATGVQGSKEATVVVFSSGLNNPRGIRVGPDKHLYVAESGLGGKDNYDPQCPDFVPYDAPYFGSTTGGRISKISLGGVRKTVTDKLPTTISIYGDVLGPLDVAFIGNNLYVLLLAGCGHGIPSVPSGIVKINTNGSYTLVADLQSWRVANPVANPPTGDFDPGGAFYNMVAVDKSFYVVDANHSDFVKATTDGTVSRVLDISGKYGHIVPAVLDKFHGSIIMGNLGLFPIVDGSTNIYRLTPDGKSQVIAKGFTAILGITVDKWGRIYVLETTTGNDFPTPGTGRIVRVNLNRSRDVIATGLSNPTGLTLGPDGNLYVLNWGFGGIAGQGEVLKVTLKN